MDSTCPFQHGLRLLHSGMPALLPQEHQAEPRRVRAPGQGRGPHRPQVSTTLNQGCQMANLIAKFPKTG